MWRAILTALLTTGLLFPGACRNSAPAVAEVTAPPSIETTANATIADVVLGEVFPLRNETTGISNVTPNVSTIKESVYLVAAMANSTAFNAPTKRGATYVVAASDTPADQKTQADATATGVADQVLINTYTNSPNREIRLQAGTYTLSGNITLASNVTLFMETGALINGPGDGSRVYRL